jgi:hypothetical protein
MTITKKKPSSPSVSPHLIQSPDGTFGPSICDGYDIWSLRDDTATMRWDGEGGGSLYCWSGGTVYVQGADQWYRWMRPGWQAYGPNPPIPLPVPPTPEPEPPPTMPPRLYRSASSWPQALCYVGTATPVVLKSTTAFALPSLIATGQEPAACAFLDWCQQQGLNCVRILTMCSNMFALDPATGRLAAVRVLELAGARGLYVEVVALADTFAYPDVSWQTHVDALAEYCRTYPNALLELCNEPLQQWQAFSPEELQALSAGVPDDVPFTLGACDDGQDESLEYCFDRSSYQTVHADRNRAPWGNVRHIREQQVMSENINQHVWNDEPGKEFTPAQQFAIGGLCRICMIGDTFHADGVRYAQIPTGQELEWFLARKAGWDFVPDTEWGTFANFGWTAPNPEPPIASVHFHDDDGRAYSLLVGSDRAYTVLLNAHDPVWKAGWSCARKEERTNRPDGQIECGIYELRR